MKTLYRLALILLILPVCVFVRLIGVFKGEDSSVERYAGSPVVESDKSTLDPYPYIFVNDDGGARELHSDERTYLETPFLPMDGARPYIKRGYSAKDGWGEIKGFLRRSRLPRRIRVQPAPLNNPMMPNSKETQIQFMRDKGFDVVENSNGSFTATPSKMFKTEI